MRKPKNRFPLWTDSTFIHSIETTVLGLYLTAQNGYFDNLKHLRHPPTINPLSHFDDYAVSIPIILFGLLSALISAKFPHDRRLRLIQTTLGFAIWGAYFCAFLYDDFMIGTLGQGTWLVGFVLWRWLASVTRGETE